MLLAPTYFKYIYIYIYMLSFATSSLYPDWPPVSAKNRAALAKPHTLTYTELKHATALTAPVSAKKKAARPLLRARAAMLASLDSNASVCVCV